MKGAYPWWWCAPRVKKHENMLDYHVMTSQRHDWRPVNLSSKQNMRCQGLIERCGGFTGRVRLGYVYREGGRSHGGNGIDETVIIPDISRIQISVRNREEPRVVVVQHALEHRPFKQSAHQPF